MFKPQLAFDSAELKVPIKFNKRVSTKLDGIRLATPGAQPLTRSLKRIPNNCVAKILSDKVVAELDGELIVGPANAEDVYRKTYSGVMSHRGEPLFTYYVFDDLSDFSLTFDQRLDKLHSRKLPSFVKILEQRLVSSQEELDQMYVENLERGFEGLIARNPDSFYNFGRCTGKSQDSLKLKPFADSEAVVLSVYEAEENLNEAFINELGYLDRSSHAENKVGKGMVGGFVVKDVVTGVEFNCSAGSMKHSERIDVWNLRSAVVGKIITYRHMTVGVKDKPRHPRFKGWRSALDM